MLQKHTVRPPPRVRPSAAEGRPKNRLLATLPDEDFQRIRADLTTFPMSVRQVLHKRGDQLRHVFFPNGGVCSITSMMRNGTAVEVATVGDEGMVGIGAFFGVDVRAGETMVQVPDTSMERMAVGAFHREMDRRGELYDRVRHFGQGTLMLMMQSTACVALHHVQERCCRWLLMTHDRVKSDSFQLSHEFLAMMLGSTRPTVTVVARSLQEAGLLRYLHARMTILDRPGLEAASCECYATVKAEFDRLGL